MYLESANLMKKDFLPSKREVISIKKVLIFIIKHFFNNTNAVNKQKTGIFILTETLLFNSWFPNRFRRIIFHSKIARECEEIIAKPVKIFYN